MLPITKPILWHFERSHQNFPFSPTKANLNGSPFEITRNPNMQQETKFLIILIVYARALNAGILNINENGIVFPKLHFTIKAMPKLLIYFSRTMIGGKKRPILKIPQS